MNKTLKTILAVIGGIVALAGIAAAVYYFFFGKKLKCCCCEDDCDTCDCDCEYDCGEEEICECCCEECEAEEIAE